LLFAQKALGLAVGLMVVLFSGCPASKSDSEAKGSGKGSGKGPPPVAEPIQASVMVVEPQSWPKIVRCQGTLVADDQTVVGSRVAGIVAETSVDIGDSVQPGQTLLRLDDREFKLQLASAEAALLQARAMIGLKKDDPLSKLDPVNAPPVREARANLDETRGRRERWEQLRSQNAVAEEELHAMQAAEKVAEARYSSAINSVNANIAQVTVRLADVVLAKQRIQDSEITAPFAGYVQQRLVSAGTFIQIGSPLVSIVRLDTLRFRGTVPERFAAQLKLGQTVRLRIESDEQSIEAQVTRISPALDLASRSLTFEALVNNRDGRWRVGLFAEGEVTLDPDMQGLIVPESALVEFAGAQKIWKVEKGNAKEQVVQVGRRSEGRIEILSGLKPGDQILVDGSQGRAAPVTASEQPAVAVGTSQGTPPSNAEPNAIKTEGNEAQAKQAKGIEPTGVEAKESSSRGRGGEQAVESSGKPGGAGSGTAGQPAG